MDEFSITGATTGDQDQPGIAGFRGTQFAAVWADRSQRSNIKGQTVRRERSLPSSSARSSIEFPQTRRARSGRTASTVIETGSGLRSRLDRHHRPVGEAQVGSCAPSMPDTLSGPENQVGAAAGRAADHGRRWRGWPTAAPSWSGPTSARTSAYARNALRYDGTKISAPEFRCQQPSLGLHRVPMVGRDLTAGNVVIAWRARLPGPRRRIALRSFRRRAGRWAPSETIEALRHHRSCKGAARGRTVRDRAWSAARSTARPASTRRSRKSTCSSRPAPSPTSGLPPRARSASSPPGRRCRHCSRRALPARVDAGQSSTPACTCRRQTSRRRSFSSQGAARQGRPGQDA